MPRPSPSSAAPGADREGWPLTALSAAALAAVFLANLAPPARAWWPALLAAAAAAVVCGLRRWPADRFWWVLAGAALGGAAGAVAPHSPAGGAAVVLPVRADVTVRDGWQSGEAGWTARVGVRRVERSGEAVACAREVRMTLPAGIAAGSLPPPGTRWDVAGELAWRRGRPLQRPQLRVKSERLLRPAGEGRAVDRLRAAAMSALLRAAGADLGAVRAAGLAAALALGRTDAVPAGEVEAMRRGGLAHLLAVSGLNVGLVGASVWGVLAAAGVRPSRRRWAAAGSMLAFAALAGWGAPVRRAAFAGAGYLAARQLGRPLLSLPVVWAVIAGIALLEPDAILQPGFQLSALVTLALVRWAAPLAARLRALPRPAAAAAAAAVVGQAASAPLVGQHFGILTWWGVAANLAAAPLAFALTVTSLLAVVAAALVPAAGTVLLAVLLPFQAALDAIAGLAAGAVSEVPPVPVAVAAAIAVLAAVGLGRTRAAAPAALGAAALWAAWAMAPWPRPPGGGEARMLPVAEGLALLLRGPGGAVLVDAGRSPSAAARALAALRVRRLEALVLTHADADHTGGAARVVGRLRVGSLVFPAAVAADPQVVALRRLARARGCSELPVAAGQRVTLAGAPWDVMWPPPVRGPSDNDTSLVARVHLAGVRVLITGDIEAAGERALLASRRELRAEVLQLPHHGSATSSSPPFLRAVGARLALAASGVSPRYPYPAGETLRRVRTAGAVVLTQRFGATGARWAPGEARGLVDGRVAVRLAARGRAP
jgi:competence protein ComEC